MLNHLAQLFVRHTCYSCESELTGQERCVCWSCLSSIPRLSDGMHASGNEPYLRFAGRVPISAATSLFYFEKKGTLQTLMQQLKYHDAPQLGVFLGTLLGHHLKDIDFVSEVECLVPIPLHRKKHILRGYNQSERIAVGMQRVLGIPVETGLLRRRVQTKTQTRMSKAERWENVQAAFQVRRPSAKRILLVDDVITTGATMEACVQALLREPIQPADIRVASVGMASHL